jgi:hypothetical protein
VVPLHPIIISILLHHCRELIQCISEVEQMGTEVNNGKKKGLTEVEEEKQE